MATEKDAAASETAATVESEATEPTELEKLKAEYAELDQKYKSDRGRLRQLEARQGHDAESEDRMAAYVTNSIRTVLEEDDPTKRMERLTELGAERERARALSVRVTDTQVELDKLVSDNKLDWANDPDLASARQAWEDNKPEEALRLASLLAREKSLKDDYVSNEEVEEIVETKLKARQAQDNTVDTGNPTAPPRVPENKPTNRAELTEYLAARRQSGNPVGKEEMRGLVRGAGGK